MTSTIERLESLISEQEYDERRIRELKGQIAKESLKAKTFKDARQICQLVLASTQTRFKIDVEALMTLAIHSVFKRFDFELEWKTGVARSDLNFNIKDGDDILNLDDDMGCSILDIISFTSRPVFHRYQKDQSRKLLVFDEGFKWVGQGEFMERAAKLIEMVSHQQGYQIIFITHEPHYAAIADKAFLVTNEGNRSSIQEVDPAEVLLRESK